MSLRYKCKVDKGVSRGDLNPDELNTNHKKVIASNADYYSEWAIEKCAVEKLKSKKSGNSAEYNSVNNYQTTNYDQYY